MTEVVKGESLGRWVLQGGKGQALSKGADWAFFPEAFSSCSKHFPRAAQETILASQDCFSRIYVAEALSDYHHVHNNTRGDSNTTYTKALPRVACGAKIKVERWALTKRIDQRGGT